jgi:RNA polymerase sigma-70 factor (ECF subfamily)
METDDTLLSAARKRNQDAWIKIFDLYSSPLYNYALRLCGDPVLADHIVGDVFAKLFDQLAAGKGPESNLRSYLYETAYHRIVDEARYSKRRVPLEAAVWLQQDRLFVPLHVEDEILFQEIQHAIRHKLTEDQRHVIILRFLEQFSLRETAAILGKRVDHVKVIQGRALVALRKTLEYNGIRKTVLSSLARQTPQSIGV